MDLTIVFPHREPMAAMAARLDEHVAAARTCSASVELVFVDASEGGSPPPALRASRDSEVRVRWLRMDDPQAGLAAALNAGLAAAAGQKILVVEPGQQYPVDQWRQALAQLARYEAVFGCRVAHERRAEPGLVRPLVRRLRDPDCLLWALRRETARGLRIPRGMQPYAAELLLWQGRRCGELVVDHRAPAPTIDWPDAQPDLTTWLAWKWLARRPARLAAHELQVEGSQRASSIELVARDAIEPIRAATVPAPGIANPPADAKNPIPLTPTLSQRERESVSAPTRIDPAVTIERRPAVAAPRLAERPLRVFFSVGEPSGDVHGANLIRALRRRFGAVDALGFAGPRMREAGCRTLYDLTLLAVMWFAAAFAHLAKFLRLLVQADRALRTEKPDAVVLIDFPGFNWHIARRAKAHGIPVFYYSPPQVWAWGSWRVRKMRRLVDHVLCGLPFEARWFNDHGCHAHYIGHPFFDEVRDHRLDARFVAERRSLPGPLVALLPGSRTQEVERNFPQFLKAVQLVLQRVPHARFAVAAYRPAHAERVRELIAPTGLPIEVYVGRTPELIAAADCCLSVSGSVSLELLHHAKPTVILYQISRTAFFVQNRFRRVKYITLVNLLGSDVLHPADTRPYDPRQADAARVLFPEYLTWQDRSADMASHLIEWLSDDAKRMAVVDRLKALRDRVGQPGAADAAAEYIGRVVAGSGESPRPHFIPGQATGSGYRYTAA